MTSVFGNGILQLLAQEMTEDFVDGTRRGSRSGQGGAWHDKSLDHSSRKDQLRVDCSDGHAGGRGGASRRQRSSVDPDLVVRPLGWKGDVPILRNFSVGAAAGGMGRWPTNSSGRRPAPANNPDVDGDGVVRKLSVGDITAMTGGHGRPGDAGRKPPRW